MTTTTCTTSAASIPAPTTTASTTTTSTTTRSTAVPSSARALRSRLLVLVVPEQPHTTVLVAGDLDCATASQLREGLARSAFYRRRSVVVDATDVSFCDLHGLDALADGIETVERSGAHVTLEPSAQLVWLCTALAALSRTTGPPD